MTSSSRVQLPTAQRLVWLRVVLSDRYGPDVTERFRRRLAAYLARTGIWPVTSATRIALLCWSYSITPLDVSLVVAWLVEQPEVVMVHRERPRANLGNRIAGRRAHG